MASSSSSGSDRPDREPADASQNVENVDEARGSETSHSTTNRQETAREYARIRRRLFVVRLAIGLAYVLVWLLAGVAIDVRSWLEARFDAPAIVVGLFFLSFLTAYELVTAPLAWYSGFHLPHRYGLSVQSFGSWLGDQAKAFGLEVAFGLAAVEVLYWLLRVAPASWWVWAAVGMLLFTVVLANLLPVLIIPLFYRLRPIDDAPLVERIQRLAERAGARVRGVYTIELSAKTTATNAALVGLGNTRRVILGDNLLSNYTSDEIEVVLAHELGHHAHRDIPKLIAIQVVVTLVSLYLADVALRVVWPILGMRDLDDVATLPLIALVLAVVGLIAMPLVNGYSRHVERQADQYALDVTRNPAALETAMRKLANQNLAELDPNPVIEFLLHDHPATGKRIAHARRFAAANSLGDSGITTSGGS